MASKPAIPARDLYIDGKWTAPVRGERLPIINPATEETIGTIPAGTAEDVDAAVKAAKSAFHRNGGKEWARAPGSVRAKFLRAIAAKVSERKAELAMLECLDAGKSLDECNFDLDDVIGCFEYYAGLAEGLDATPYSDVKVAWDSFKASVRKEALGVVALITPWNYPLMMAAWKVAPALAAGCCAVLKPSELASMTCLELGAIAQEVGLPAGVLNIVTGLGTAAGAPLAAHPMVDKIAFTGSGRTGRSISLAAAEQLKPASMELGGKSSLIVFDDIEAELDKAVEWALFGCFYTNGQICSATSRLLLQEGIAPAFLKRLQEWIAKIKIGDPSETGCRLGPIVSEAQYKKVVDFVESGKREGATLLTGGRRPQHLPRGYFLEPTVFTDVTAGMRIWNEEIFGPVLSVQTFKTEEEAVKVANDTVYGLGGAVISKDQERCRRVAEALEVGVVWINCSQPAFVQGPWGGRKRSGFGRELGEWGLENFLSVKQVVSYVSGDQWGYYTAP